jgi:DNA-binding NtrC family response regulator
MVFGTGLRVLIVDDEPSICKALTVALTRAGYEAVAAQSGDAACALARAEHFDIMLIDLRIPDQRGDAIFQYIASVRPHLKTQTLFITGDITERAQRLIQECACPMLRKPFDLSDVLNAVAALVPEHRAREASA